MKLAERELSVQNICAGCITMLQDSLRAMPGVHYVRYDSLEQRVLFKYDTASFSSRRLGKFLNRQKLFRVDTDSTLKPPSCCNTALGPQ